MTQLPKSLNYSLERTRTSRSASNETVRRLRLVRAAHADYSLR
jgi:hypothetical protein